MPNRYSHALVLSHYESLGFISRPTRSSSRPSSTTSLLSFDLDPPSSSDDSTAPSLTPSPGLSESSASSTVSSLDEAPQQQSLHSASSSIVTEIYAPQSPTVGPVQTSNPPVEERDGQGSPPPSPVVRERATDQPPPTSTSRFPSASGLSAFLHPRSSTKRKSKSSKKRRSTVPTASEHLRKQSHQLESSAPHPFNALLQPHPQTRRDHTPYKRLAPTFSVDPLPSPCLDDERPRSPNSVVVPWEYSETHLPPVYRPRGVSDHLSTDLAKDRDSGYHSSGTTRTSRSTTSATVPHHHLCYPAPVPTHPPSSPLHELPQPHPFHQTSSPSPLSPASSNVEPTSLLLPSQEDYTPLSRSSSFDSVAPPPISLGPRHPFNPTLSQQSRNRNHAFATWLDRAGGGRRDNRGLG
ncbi:MAG: hypothetical protein Q9201_006702 [Fulgogasparrea decipioides]